MKITGISLARAIKDRTKDKVLFRSQFEDSLTKFSNEQKPNPINLMGQLQMLAEEIAVLQVAQVKYNLAVKTRVGHQEMTLADVLRRLSTAEEIENLWKTASVPKRDLYYGRPTRAAGEEVAQSVLSREDLENMYRDARRNAARLREAMQKGNAVEIEIEGLEPSLFRE